MKEKHQGVSKFHLCFKMNNWIDEFGTVCKKDIFAC